MNHHIFILPAPKVKRQRYLRGSEHLALQGIWNWSYKGAAFKAMQDLSESSTARLRAGNAFSTTVALATTIASLVSCSAWYSIAQRHHSAKIPQQVPGDEDGVEDGDSSSLRKASFHRGLSSPDVTLQQAAPAFQIVKHEVVTSAEAPSMAEIPTESAGGMPTDVPHDKPMVDTWLEDFLDEEEARFEVAEKREATKLMPPIMKSFHGAKPTQLFSGSRQSPRSRQVHGEHARRTRKRSQVDAELEKSTTDLPAVQPQPAQQLAQQDPSAAPCPGGPPVAENPAKKRLRGKQQACEYAPVVIPRAVLEPKPDGEGEEAGEAKDEPAKKRHKRGDSISIAKKLAACKEYEQLIKEHGKALGQQKFYELKLPGWDQRRVTNVFVHTNIPKRILEIATIYNTTYIHACMHTYIDT